NLILKGLSVDEVNTLIETKRKQWSLGGVSA
ncbi:unnamed protein product, partial [marine sediment metagenome]